MFWFRGERQLNFFGTTKGLVKKFGSERVFETPTSENAMTGIGVGMSLNNNPCVMMHQRLDFFISYGSTS